MKGKTESKLSGIIRIGVVALAIIFQLLLMVLLIGFLRDNAFYAYMLIEISSLIAIFALAIQKTNSAYTITWILVIVTLPLFGYLLYLLWGRTDRKNPMHRRVSESIEYGNQFIDNNDTVIDELHILHPYKKQVYGHLERKGFGVYKNTDCQYFPLGEQQFDAMIADMENAKQHIFLCYFILNTGRLWNRVYDVITRKAAEGVEIRLMYDDVGSIFTAPDNFIANLEKKGIQVVRFSPAHKFISSLLINYRNHQKITVIDGNIGYTGGTNLADEYANYYAKHGHWKDNAIRLEGDATWGLTVIFLQMWDSQTGGYSDYDAYRPQQSSIRIWDSAAPQGYFIPFADGPNNNPDNPAEAAYRNMIANACQYLYITTPYLVIDGTMRELLCTAATAGVDVRIITPYIWDHWYVKYVSRANYKLLLQAGVKIYEYTPGFIHAKTIISDDEHCIVGTINMDYRSFNLHYENGVWMSNTDAIADIKDDLIQTLEKCERIDMSSLGKIPWPKRLVGNVLRLFEVLM